MYNPPHTGVGSALLAIIALAITGLGFLLKHLGRSKRAGR
jgi:LPXTG-motif cell wall-anchored protein